jgi:hypothetical protein
MILLDDVKILSAVQRSLDAHVLPQLQDDFARVQVTAAQKALQEVIDRLTEGDPLTRTNEALAAGARQIADECRANAPDFAAGIEAALLGSEEIEDPRERNRQVGEALWQLVSGNDSTQAKQLLKLIYDQAIQTLTADARYVSPEAIASLT